jgi:hypothetical protein
LSDIWARPLDRATADAPRDELTRVLAFDPDINLTPLVDLSEELAGVRDRIARTDALIDQIVYRLYGLTEEEIAVVEGR